MIRNKNENFCGRNEVRNGIKKYFKYYLYVHFLHPEVLPDIMRGKAGYTGSTLFVGA